MIRKRIFLRAAQALFTLLQVYLVSRISLIGRIGIALVHREYALLRSGWKTFLLFFSIQLIIILVLAFMYQKRARKEAVLAASVLLALAVCGLLYTYNDFMHTYSHRLLKERFHLGLYLFWIGWMGTCIFFLVISPKKPQAPWPEDQQGPAS